MYTSSRASPDAAAFLMAWPTPRSLRYAAAVSIWRYPASRAVVTARSVSSGGVWKTPSPTWGIALPSLSVIKGEAMTSSLPAHAQQVPSRKEAVLNTLASVTLRALPRIPNAVKRAMLGGRSVTIDGNTLDTTLQLMLAGMTAIGRNSLILSNDVDVARQKMRIVVAGFKQDIPVAAVTN